MFSTAEFSVAKCLAAQETWLVVGDQDNAESREVWAHLKTVYQLEDSQLLELDFPDGDELNRTQWEDQLRPIVVQWLQANDPDQRYTKIVTLYGLPLSVGPWDDDRETKPWLDFYQNALIQTTGQFNRSLSKLGEVAGLKYDAIQSSNELEPYRTGFDQFANKVQAAIAGLATEKQRDVGARLQTTVQEIAGINPFLASLQRDAESGKSQANVQFQYLRGRIEALDNVGALLERVPPSFERESLAMSLLEQSGGLLATIGWIQQQIAMVLDNDSAASLDSELACLLWPEYRRLGTVPNFAHPAFANSPLTNKYPTFQVSRLDGPTVAIAKALVDRAKAAETMTFEGNVYLDLRGIDQGDTQTVRYERWMKAIGQQFQNVAGVKVVQEKTPQLFAVDACPDALLYCGWYSLGKSIDSFTFKPGGVAYHLVPGDALGIHQVDDQGWCKYFLEKGATRIIGSVGEIQPVDFQLDGGKLKFAPPVLSSGLVEFGL